MKPRFSEAHWPSIRSVRVIAAILLVGLLAAGILPGHPSAQEEELWQALLREQLQTEVSCKLNYTTNVRKFELAGQQMVEARAHCYDKRMYDVSWQPDKQKFDIRSCEPTAC